MKRMFDKYKYFLLLIILAAISWLYGYHEILHKRPDSFHTWRQTDCTSLALNYHQLKMPFFEPQLHNLSGNEGRSIGEFPIIYFIVGKLYDVFGPHEFIFRLFSTLIFFLGLFYLFRLGLLLFESVFYSSALVVIAFSSPLIAFYAISFIPDVHALSLSYVAWYYIALYIKRKQLKHFVLAMLIFALAGILKITALMSLCVIICLLAFELIFIKKEKRWLASDHNSVFWWALVPFVVFFIWLSYAHYYQKINSNGYFSLDWDPFWLEDAATRKYIWNRLTKNWGWWPDFYRQNIMLAAALGLILLLKNGVSYFWRAGIFAYLCGVSLFITMYFSALNHHDYYMINLLSVIPFIYIFIFISLKGSFLYKNLFFRIIIAMFLISGVWHASKRVDYRFSLELNEEIRPFYHMDEAYLLSVGIKPDTKILYDGENMYNGVLYLINRFGWSRTYEKFDNKEMLDLYTQKGAEFLMVVGEERAGKEVYSNLSIIDVFEESIYIFKLTKEED
jgi:MFS family permease